jgi:superfamily I DNA and/or RNA helicase
VLELIKANSNFILKFSDKNTDVEWPIGKGIGFLADIRRMNVALTRAKFALWVVGNSKMLSQNSHWKQFIDFSKKNGFCITFNFYTLYMTKSHKTK